MPPKNKKQLEQQAKRLEQQQKKRQQQERLLEQERKKYASQLLKTGLMLPVSNQLLTQFVSQQSTFINEKLRHIINSEYKNLTNERILKQVLKEMLYIIKNSRLLFKISQKSTYQNNQSAYLKARVTCGIYLKIFLNNHPAAVDPTDQRVQKNRETDQKQLKQLILSHSQQKNQNQQKIFQRSQVLQLLSFFKQNYFDHYLILNKFDKFQKRSDSRQFSIFMATPWLEHNTAATLFVDLSDKVKTQQKLVQ